MWLVPEKAITTYSLLGLVQNKALEAEAIREELGSEQLTLDSQIIWEYQGQNWSWDMIGYPVCEEEVVACCLTGVRAGEAAHVS